MKSFTLDMQSKYMRIPFKEHGRGFDGCDCGGLLILIYRNELGIELPDLAHLYQTTQIESWEDVKETISRGVREYPSFVEVPKGEAIQPFDVIVFNIASHPIHIGIVVNDRMFIHILEGYTNVRQERIHSANWIKRIEGIYRYVR